ncbi:MAG: hypothetical protein BECKG1743E_GA0114224_110831 [Candidatus Kentron sp. G]|nr:MAG: hypothetical protein BECKG1743E_GA0114224_110831 [Candidatus Kentron sp. G]
MRLLLRLESEQNDRAIRYILFWQSPYRKPGGVSRIRLIRKTCRSISDKVQ